MYNSYYGLTFNPFDKQQLREKDHFISRDFTEMTNRLNYLKDIRGIGVFTARPGMGKSYALRCFAASLNPSLYHMEYLCLSTISVADFYKQLCAILGVSDKGGKTGMFKAIQEQIAYLYKEKRQPLLLAIDEAQYLNTGILNDIKMLMNYGYDSVNCFTLILCGESHLNDTHSASQYMKRCVSGSPSTIITPGFPMTKCQSTSCTKFNWQVHPPPSLILQLLQLPTALRRVIPGLLTI